MNDSKAKLFSTRAARSLVTLIFGATLILPLSGCGSKPVAKEQNQTFPAGVVEGYGKVVSINPDMEVLVLQLTNRQVTLWISRTTEYYHGKKKISPRDIKPGSRIDFEGWSFGTDVAVKKVILK